MLRRLKSRRLALASAAMALALFAWPAEAMVFSCFPERDTGKVRIDAYVDGFVPEGWPPNEISSLRVLARLGQDLYEFFPEQVKRLEFRDSELHIHFEQPLSAGATAELRLEGKLSAQKGEPFMVRIFMRNEWRSAEGAARCTID